MTQPSAAERARSLGEHVADLVTEDDDGSEAVREYVFEPGDLPEQEVAFLGRKASRRQAAIVTRVVRKAIVDCREYSAVVEMARRDYERFRREEGEAE